MANSSSDFSFEGPFRKSRRGADIHLSLALGDNAETHSFSADLEPMSSQRSFDGFDFNSSSSVDDFQKKSAESNRLRSLQTAQKRIHLKETFVRWVRSVHADLPFHSLNTVHINFLIQAHLDPAITGVDFEKSGLIIPVHGPDVDSDTVNNSLNPHIFFASLSMENCGVTFSALEPGFWEVGKKIDGFSIPKLKGQSHDPVTSPVTPKTPTTPADNNGKHGDNTDDLMKAVLLKFLNPPNAEPHFQSKTSAVRTFPVSK